MESFTVARPRRRMSGFTLVELLVVIGIIALLIGILLPSLARSRRAAKDIVCANNLRQFVVADNMYLADNKVYPLPALSFYSTGNHSYLGWPYLLDGGMVNVLGSYLHLKNPIPNALNNANAAGIPLGVGNYPLLAYMSQMTAAKAAGVVPTWGQLPVTFKSPEYVDAWGSNGPSGTTGTGDATQSAQYDSGGFYAYNQTGYTCFTSMTETTVNGLYPMLTTPYAVGSGANPSGSYDQFLNPNDIGTRKHRGVLWADALWFYGVNSTWYFSHSNSAGLTSSIYPRDIRGQHSAYSDGSVIFSPVSGTNSNVLKASSSVQLSATMCYAAKAYFWATLTRP